MEELQNELTSNAHSIKSPNNQTVQQDSYANSNSHHQQQITILQQENSALKTNTEQLYQQLKRTVAEKNRLLDMSNSIKAQLRVWKEVQENKKNCAVQSRVFFLLL